MPRQGCCIQLDAPRRIFPGRRHHRQRSIGSFAASRAFTCRPHDHKHCSIARIVVMFVITDMLAIEVAWCC